MKRPMLMKRIAISFVFICIALATNAQKSSAYLKAGINFANVSTTSDGAVDDANTLTSFHVGFMGDLTIAKIFAIQTGVLLNGKGAKIESGDPNGATYYKATTNPLYIEIPVNAVFKLPMGPVSSFYFGAGPYAAIGIAGKRKIEGKLLGASFSDKTNIEFSNDDPTTLDYEEGAGLGIMKRFDVGLNAVLGFQINRGIIGLNYGYGLSKLQSGADNDDDYNKHRVLSVTVGFKL